MASGSIRPAAAAPAARVSADKLIDTQLGRVRRHIRLTDLIAGIMILFAGIFAFLILAAIVDHWIVGLGFVGRLLLLVVLVGGVGWHLAVNVVPLLLRRINPAYAAQTIERGEPSLKNSLLNYLLLRRESDGMSAIVYQAVQQRAAADVARVEVEQTVDRTALIRAGYVLAGIMALSAAYKILSPKDPFQTVRRIASPWSDIARPARVTIEGVEPGNAEVVQGQTVEISAIVRGQRGDEEVQLVYSSVDGQVVDRRVVMKPDSADLRHVAQLPQNESRSNPHGLSRTGIQQELVYRISAGDAATAEFRLRPSPAPTMTVEAVEYDYPAYTRRSRELVAHQGDIKAVEGTRVTIRAHANQPIRTASVELTSTPNTVSAPDINAPGINAPGVNAPGVNAPGVNAPGINERLAMEFRDADAWRSWILELASDRQSPKFTAYQATFVNQKGLASRDPVTHRIEVIPDLPPEVEILTPAKETTHVSVSGEQRIEVRAIDPDFGLSSVRLKAVCGGREFLDQPLFEDTAGQSGQKVVEFKFRPREFQLSAGSQITYWAVAADNRHTESAPLPNTMKTPNRTLIVVEDPPASQSKPNDSAAEKPETQSGDSPPMSPSDPAPGDKPQPTNSKDTSKSKDSNSKEKGPQEPKQQDSKQQKSKQEESDQGTKDKKSAGGKSGSGKESNKQSNDKQQGGSSGKGQPQSAQGKSGKQESGDNSGSDQPTNSQPGQGAANGNEPSANPPQPNSTDNSGNKETTPGRDPNAAGEVREGDPPGKGSEPLHDGEVFERALDQLRKKQQEQGKPGTPQSPEKTQSPENKGAEDPQGSSGAPDQSTKPAEKPSAKKTGDSTDQRNPQPKPEQQPGEPNDKPSATKGTPAEKQDGSKKEGNPSKQEGTPKQKPAERNNEGTKQPGDHQQGKSGAGQKDDGKAGASKKTTEGDRPLKQRPDNAPSPPGEPPPPNESERTSDSKGENSGDRSGGGKKGAGQGAKQAGKDTAGSSSPSEEGAGAAHDPGSGDKSSKPGTQQPSAKPTGSSGDEKGPGSQSKSDPQGNQPSPSQPTPDAGKSEQSKDKNREPGGANSGGKSPGGPGNPTSGGQPADRPAGNTPPDAEVAPGDDANLEYSRRATDMVLEYLKNQKDKPDDRLLDEMGWTADDLRGFLDRWQKLKQSAAEDPAARRELDESLRGLGLRPQKDSKRVGGTRTDDLRGLRESGIKSVPPSTYQEQFNAFKKGAASSQPK